MGKQQLIDFVVDWCADDRHGYDQVGRWGPDADCSSLIYMAAVLAGYALPTSGTRYTGTMMAHFTAAGFTARRFSGLAGLTPGEILLNERDHTELCVAPGKLGGASINERGQVAGGVSGDQTGAEIRITSAYVYSAGWDWVLAPPMDAKPSNLVTLWSPHAGWNQRWVPLPQGDGTYKLGNAANGCVLDVEGGKDEPGTAVIWWPDKGDDAPNQRWIIEPVYPGEGRGMAYSIISAMPVNLAVDIEKASADDGARAIAWPYHGGANQLFGIVPTGDGESVYIVSCASGKVLDANL